MIVLDTNVVSEVLKPRREPAVVAWLNRQAAETLCLTAVSLSELLLGIELLDEGRRKRELANSLRDLLESLFGPRVLPFDDLAAVAYATLMSEARRKGRTIAFADGQIAASAQARGFPVATRDKAPFAAAGVRVIDPWNA